MKQLILGLLCIGVPLQYSALQAQSDTTRVGIPKLAEHLEESMLIQGGISQLVGDNVKAIEYYLLGLEKSPKSTALLLGLSESYVDLGDLKSALFYAKEARNIDPKEVLLIDQSLSILLLEDDQDAVEELIRTAKELGLSSRKLTDAEMKLTEIQGDNVTVDYESLESEILDSFLNTLNSINKASFSQNRSDSLKQSIENSKLEGHHKSYLFGRIYFLSGDFEGASETLEKVTKENPKNVSAWAYLIRAASRNGQQDDAKRFSQKAQLLFPYQQEISLAEIFRLIESNRIDSAISKLDDLKVEEELLQEKEQLLEMIATIKIK